MNHKTGVYAIINLIDGKKYVGSASRSIYKRWDDHRRDLANGRHHSIHLQRAWDKYGEVAFVFQVVAICNPDMCLRLEQLWINCFRTADRQYGYNMSPTAGSTRGKMHTEEAIERMRNAHRGHKQSAEWVSKRVSSMRNRGTKRKSPPARSYEHRMNLSAAMKGKIFSDEHRRNLSLQAKKRYESNSVEFMGENRNLKEICKERGLPYKTVWSRIKKAGWSVYEALTVPIGGQRIMAGGGGSEGEM